MHHRQRLFQFAGALLWSCAVLVPSPAANATDVVRAQREGVSVEVTALRDHVAFCITAANNLKISSEYGVEFKVDGREARLWNERLPKTVTAAPYYFDLPLRIELKSRGDVRQHRIELDLGACSEATLCTPVQLKLTLPSNYSGGAQCGSGTK